MSDVKAKMHQIRFPLDTTLVNREKAKSFNHRVVWNNMADQLADKDIYFSCTSKGLWDDSDDQSQQSSRARLVSQPITAI